MTEWPITLQQAAEMIHASERWLRGHLKLYPSGRKAGRRIIFTEEDYNQLLDSLQTMKSINAKKSHAEPDITILSNEEAQKQAVEMAKEGKRKAVER